MQDSNLGPQVCYSFFIALKSCIFFPFCLNLLSKQTTCFFVKEKSLFCLGSLMGVHVQSEMWGRLVGGFELEVADGGSAHHHPLNLPGALRRSKMFLPNGAKRSAFKMIVSVARALIFQEAIWRSIYLWLVKPSCVRPICLPPTTCVFAPCHVRKMHLK